MSTTEKKFLGHEVPIYTVNTAGTIPSDIGNIEDSLNKLKNLYNGFTKKHSN